MAEDGWWWWGRKARCEVLVVKGFVRWVFGLRVKLKQDTW